MCTQSGAICKGENLEAIVPGFVSPYLCNSHLPHLSRSRRLTRGSEMHVMPPPNVNSPRVQCASSNPRSTWFVRCRMFLLPRILQIMNKNFPQVLYPVFRLQQSTQRSILGNRWWSKKVTTSRRLTLPFSSLGRIPKCSTRNASIAHEVNLLRESDVSAHACT